MKEELNPEFHNHIHPTQDLFKYLEDTSANDDPIDHTMNDKFEFNVYSSRWGHLDEYKLTRTAKGWFVDHMSYKGEDKHYNSEVLYDVMIHDSISFLEM